MLEKISTNKEGLLYLLENTSIVWVDIDGVLSDTISAALAEVRSRYGDIMDFSDWKKWNPHEIQELQEKWMNSIQDTIDLFYDILKKDGKQPVNQVDGSKEGIEMLINSEKELVALSGRIKDSREYTEGWLTENYGDVFNSVLLTDHDTPKQVPKYELAQKYGIGLMIEDNAHYAIDLVIHGIPTILLETPWNIDIDTSSYPDLYRVKNWSEIVSLMEIM